MILALRLIAVVAFFGLLIIVPAVYAWTEHRANEEDARRARVDPRTVSFTDAPCTPRCPYDWEKEVAS